MDIARNSEFPSSKFTLEKFEEKYHLYMTRQLTAVENTRLSCKALSIFSKSSSDLSGVEGKPPISKSG